MAIDTGGLLLKFPTFHLVHEDGVSLNFTGKKTQWATVETGSKLESFDVRFVPNCRGIPSLKHQFEVNVREISANSCIPGVKIAICSCITKDRVLFLLFG